jgi:alginate O-acetyltransferase complex protein AlgI
MVFSSVVFLCFFLPAVLTLYYLTPPRYRNLTALASSLVFYAWGAPDFVAVLVLASVVDFTCSRRMIRYRGLRRAKLLLTAAVLTNLVIFLYCKYMNFFVDQVNHVLGWAQCQPVAWTAVVMPIGISFFTFQKLSYLIDVYRGEAEPAPTFGHYLLYVTLFPQLIAGPIVRYHDVSQQLVRRCYSDEQFLVGAWRFAVGLAKKVILANTLASVADAAFGSTAHTVTDPHSLTCGAAWLAAVCYAMQLYFDFSGYSDMAIGLGKMLGFHFLENFDYPYVARSVTEFWRRWHISLSNWMREYLYIPLGGNRVAAWRVYLNLWIVFVLSGFWHGASWNFIVWGGLHGALLTGERFARARNWRPWPAALAIPRTFLLVLTAWVFFRAWDLSQAVQYLQVMFAPRAATAAGPLAAADLLDPATGTALAAALLLSVAPLLGRFHRVLDDWTISDHDPREYLQLTLRAGCSVVLLIASYALLVTSSFNPFIYFRF